MRGHAMIAERTIRLAALAPMMIAALMLTGCVSFGGEVPENLLTLTPDLSAPAGSGHSGTRENAIAIHEPEVPAEVDVLRVPVRVDAVNIAYLKDATWVEKRSEERRVGKECVSTCRFRWSPYH